MSNTFAPNGFQFIRNYQSASPTYQRSIAQILYTNSNSFGKGDVVTLGTGGYIDRAQTSDTQVYGVLDGVEYYDSGQQKKIFANAWLDPSNVLAGSALAYVITDPQAVFQVQSGNGGPVLQANTGENINFASNAAPNTSTGISTAYADFATLSTTSTLPFRVINVPQNGINGPIGNDSTSIYNVIEVTLNSCDARLLTGLA